MFRNPNKDNKKIIIDWILKDLRKCGVECSLFGGWVRDSFFNLKETEDIDVFIMSEHSLEGVINFFKLTYEVLEVCSPYEKCSASSSDSSLITSPVCSKSVYILGFKFSDVRLEKSVKIDLVIKSDKLPVPLFDVNCLEQDREGNVIIRSDIPEDIRKELTYQEVIRNLAKKEFKLLRPLPTGKNMKDFSSEQVQQILIFLTRYVKMLNKSWKPNKEDKYPEYVHKLVRRSGFKNTYCKICDYSIIPMNKHFITTTCCNKPMHALCVKKNVLSNKKECPSCKTCWFH
jgi:hypothetical protein